MIIPRILGEMENVYKILTWKYEGRNYLGHLGVYERITLNESFKLSLNGSG
jgi:hypothetical protein